MIRKRYTGCEDVDRLVLLAALKKIYKDSVRGGSSHPSLKSGRPVPSRVSKRSA